MSKIEIITRLHSAKTISIECASGGRAVLDKDVLIGVLAIVSRDYPLGADAILARYLDDGEAATRCLTHLEQLGRTREVSRPDLHPFFAAQAIAVFCGKLLVSQQKKVKSLYKRYGTYASRSKQRLKKFRLALRRAENRDDQNEIARYSRLIDGEHRALDEYAERKAAATDICPRCRGTGTVALHPCDDCNATGHIQVNPRLMRAYIRNSGVAMSDKLFDELWAYFEACLNQLYSEAGAATAALTRQLEKEKE